jgi:hypothetical protein
MPDDPLSQTGQALWAEVLVRFPDPAAACPRAATMLQRFDEAGDVLRQAMELLPTNRSVIFAHAELATRRNDWAGALACRTRGMALPRRSPFAPGGRLMCLGRNGS